MFPIGVSSENWQFSTMHAHILCKWALNACATSSFIITCCIKSMLSWIHEITKVTWDSAQKMAYMTSCSNMMSFMERGIMAAICDWSNNATSHYGNNVSQLFHTTNGKLGLYRSHKTISNLSTNMITNMITKMITNMVTNIITNMITNMVNKLLLILLLIWLLKLILTWLLLRLLVWLLLWLLIW